MAFPPSCLLESHSAVTGILHEHTAEDHSLVNASCLLALRVGQLEQSNVVLAAAGVIIGSDLADLSKRGSTGRVEDLHCTKVEELILVSQYVSSHGNQGG